MVFVEESWWLLDAAFFGNIALAIFLWAYVGKYHLHPTFKHQGWILLIAWPVIVFCHLHLSGYGATSYLAGMGSMDWMRVIPFFNWYNANPFGPQAGYDTMYVLHGVAGGLFTSTFDLFFSELSLGWCLFFALEASTTIQVSWEMTEVQEGLVRCNSNIFPTIQAACNEMGLRIQHQCYTTGAALAVILVFALIFWLKDRHDKQSS
jgi:hypothetical protein